MPRFIGFSEQEADEFLRQREALQDGEEWADDHGYWHWTCRKCGMSGWTDTQPDCDCQVEEEDEMERDRR